MVPKLGQSTDACGAIPGRDPPFSIPHTSHSCSQSSGGASLPFMLCGQFPLQKWKGLVFAIWVQRTETAPMGKLRSLKPEDSLRTQDPGESGIPGKCRRWLEGVRFGIRTNLRLNKLQLDEDSGSPKIPCVSYYQPIVNQETED